MTRIEERIRTLVNSRTGRRFLGGTFWSVSGALVSRGCLFLTIIAIVRLLGREAYGQFGYIQSTLNLFLVLGTCCLGYAASKIIAESLHVGKECLERNLTILYALVMGLVVFCGFLFVVILSILCRELQNNTLTLGTICCAGLLLMLSAWMNFQAGVLAGFQAYSSVAKAEFSSALCILIFPVVGAAFWGISGVIGGFCLTMVCSCSVNAYCIRLHKIKYGLGWRFSHCRPEFFKILNLCLPWVASGILATGGQWICHTMLVRQNNGFSEMAILSVVLQIHAIIIFLPTKMSQLLVPILSEARGLKKDQTQRQWIFGILTLLVIMATVGVIGPFVLFSSRIFCLFGNAFSTVDRSIIMETCLVSIFVMINFSFNQWFIAEGKTWIFVPLNIFWTAVLIGTTYYLLLGGAGASSVIFAMNLAYGLRIVLGTLYFSMTTQWRKMAEMEELRAV